MTAAISPQQLSDLVRRGKRVTLLDVRTPVEFREVHVGFARNVPLDRLESELPQLAATDAAQPLYVICRSGNRARQACERLAAAGYANAVNVEGGTLAWEQAGLPVVCGKKAISLDRQVRIAAGSLVLVGAALGAFVSPYWIALAAFVGAGLVFAGVTDTCGMGLLLARMPWNQVRSDAAAPTAAGGQESAASGLPTCCR